MFIELADHLRCPELHDEQFLVLLPDEMHDRSVRTGQLGCPVCNRTFDIVDGVFDVGGTAPESPALTALNADAVAALAGLGGPGGYMVLSGPVADLAESVALAIPRVGIVAFNPGAAVRDDGAVSVIRGAQLPIKSSSMRSVVLGPGYAQDPAWIAEALRVTLSGLRVVGEGPDPASSDLEILASAGGCWVGSKLRNRLKA